MKVNDYVIIATDNYKCFGVEVGDVGKIFLLSKNKARAYVLVRKNARTIGVSILTKNLFVAQNFLESYKNCPKNYFV